MRTNQRRQRANEDDITYVVQLSINRCVHQFYLIFQLGLGLNIWSFVSNKEDTERNYVPDSSPVSRACYKGSLHEKKTEIVWVFTKGGVPSPL